MFTTVDHHQMSTCWIKSYVPNSISWKWLDYSEAIHISVHTVKVPQPNMIIKTSCCHSNTFWINSHTWYCSSVTFQSCKILYRNSHLVKTFINPIWYFLELILLLLLLLLWHLFLTWHELSFFIIFFILRIAFNIKILSGSNHRDEFYYKYYKLDSIILNINFK